MLRNVTVIVPTRARKIVKTAGILVTIFAVVLFAFILYVRVNIFSVMSGQVFLC